MRLQVVISPIRALLMYDCGPDGCRVRMTDTALVVTWLHPHYQYQPAYAWPRLIVWGSWHDTQKDY
jgi:hypothetical protein